MNKRLEKEEFDNFVDDLSEDSKKLIDVEPAFVYKGQMIRLDFIGKADRLFLTKVFEEIEKNKNEKMDLDKFKKDAEQEILKIKKAQAKEFITVKEFSLLYNKSVKTQQAYRSRPKNHIPFIQKKLNDSILYNKTEVEEWLKEKDLW